MYNSGFRSFNYRLTPWVKRLILANTVFFLVTMTGVIPLSWAFEFLGFKSSLSKTLMEPWTIVTYMFVHADFFHLFFNMLFLFFFGVPLEERWGGREFIKYYVICGLGGALFTVLFGGGTIVGASGAIYGILLAYALNWPDAQIWFWGIFPIKAKYLVMFLGAIAFFQTFPMGGGSDGIAHFAHLGGLVVGYIYLKKGWALQGRYEGIKKRVQMRKFSVVPGGKDSGTETESGRSSREARMLEEVDRLLDKIAADGIDSLSEKERQFLDQVSRSRQKHH